MTWSVLDNLILLPHNKRSPKTGSPLIKNTSRCPRPPSVSRRKIKLRERLPGGAWFDNKDFKEFAYVAASLMRMDLSIDDPANENIYKTRAAEYEKWRDALYAAESKKSWSQQIAPTPL